ncbi:MAG: hypothetical protein ABH919_02810 [bacterium]
MEPFQRFKKLNTEGNLWVYVLSLGKEGEVREEDIARLIFEKFGFLPGSLLVKKVLYLLKKGEYIKGEKYKGKKAYRTTEKGLAEMEKMKKFYQELLQKI